MIDCRRLVLGAAEAGARSRLLARVRDRWSRGAYTRLVRLLAWFVLRSLAVTLLLATVVTPLGDHHALARLGALGGAQPEDTHWLLVHHHGKGAAAHEASALASSLTLAAGLPGLSPSSPPTDPTTASLPVALPVVLLALIAVGAWRLFASEGEPPDAAYRRVPVPPPRLLVVAGPA